MKIDNNPTAQRPSRGWAEHRAAKNKRLAEIFATSHAEIQVERNVRPVAHFVVVPVTQTGEKRKDGKPWVRQTGVEYIITDFESKGQYDLQVVTVEPPIYANPDAVKIQRVNPDRIEQRAERKASQQVGSMRRGKKKLPGFAEEPSWGERMAAHREEMALLKAKRDAQLERKRLRKQAECLALAMAQ